MENLKLTIDLIPQTTWNNNLRNKISNKEWDKIRRKCYADYNHQCGICGSKSNRLNCHEKWEFNEEDKTQKLIGFIALCDLCHHIKHIGFANILISQGKLDYNLLINHFLKVNKCSKEDFDKCVKDAFELWEKRSKENWKVL